MFSLDPIASINFPLFYIYILADCRRRNGFTLRFHRGLPRFKNKKNRLGQSFFNFQENQNEGK
jgi:hypothetical protein